MANREKIANAEKTGKLKNSSIKPLLWVILLSIVLLKFPESILVLFIGILPTMVAFVVDKSSGKYATFCVGSMNVTGIFPAIYALWTGKNNMSQAIQIITDVFDLVIMYGAAGIGWILYIIIPTGVSALLTIIGQRRISRLRNRQRELILEWGKDIAEQTDKDVEQNDKTEHLELANDEAVAEKG